MRDDSRGSTTGTLAVGAAILLALTASRCGRGLYPHNASPDALLLLTEGPSYSFGAQFAGGAFDKIFTLTNQGAQAAAGLSVSAPSRSIGYGFKGGSYPGVGGTCGSSLSAGASCTFVITFTPPVSGNYSASLTITYSSGSTAESAALAVSGRGLGGGYDSTFGSGGYATTDFSDLTLDSAHFSDVALQTDGKIVSVTRAFDGASGYYTLVRYNSDGSADTTFSGDGRALVQFGATDDNPEAMAIQTDGKFVLAGELIADSFGVARITANGAADTTFNTNGSIVPFVPVGAVAGQATSVALQSDGKIVAAGWSRVTLDRNFAIARLTTGGVADSTFDADGKLLFDMGSNFDNVYQVRIQTDGKIVVGGVSDFAAIARVLTNGTLDSTFSGDGKATYPDGLITDFLIQPDGKIVAIGDGVFIMRILTDGNLDPTFGSSGITTTTLPYLSVSANALSLQSDGKFVVTGRVSSTQGQVLVMRYTSDGALDSTFGTDGTSVLSFSTDDLYGNAVAIDSAGRIVAAGGAGNAPSVIRAIP